MTRTDADQLQKRVRELEAEIELQKENAVKHRIAAERSRQQVIESDSARKAAEMQLETSSKSIERLTSRVAELEFTLHQVLESHESQQPPYLASIRSLLKR